MLIVGGIARKPAVVEDRVQARDLLNLTIAFDHDVVDGAPAARFITRLVELIEGGTGLEEGSLESPAPFSVRE
ncbi:2-oxo acid dehydrogenase subunit E2 [Microlunatus panaciterrae]|uniref:2-oxo acid dehydrogenase subunit E2 n=1 Tax=Microlunatus panaciterrae TaxID=400768 RepID=UPI001EF787C3